MKNATVKLYERLQRESKSLTKEEEKELFIAYQSGDEYAKEKIILSHITLVFKLTNNYKDSKNYEDYIQVAMEGLQLALPGYDLESGFRFSTYAAFWIRKTVLDYRYGDGSGIKLSERDIEDFGKVDKAREEYYQQYGRYPSTKKIEEMTGIKNSEFLIKAIYDKNATSLNKEMGEDGDVEIHEIIGDQRLDVAETVKKNEVRSLLDMLDEQSKTIMDLKYFQGYKAEEIAERLHISKNKVDSIVKKSKKIIRAQAGSYHDYVR